MLPHSFNLMSKSYNWLHLLCLLPWLDQNLVSHIFQLSAPWIQSVRGLSTQSFAFTNDVRGFGFINRSLPNIPPEGTIYGAFTANLFRKILLPYYFWDNYCNPQSYKKHSLLALCSLLYATYGICSRQGELTDRRLVELEGQSPVFSIFLSLIHPKMPDPHRLEVSFLNPFQIEGRDNPI